MMRKLFMSCLMVVLVLACGKDDPPPAPEAALLVFPEENSECTTGNSLSENLSQVTFRWNASKNTDQYTLSVINLNTNIPQNVSTSTTSASLTIAKGTPFSWSLSSRNNDSDEVAVSDTWLFYNAGSQTTYAPFPAQLVSPESGSTVQKNLANEVLLQWIGADADNDLASFEVLFSTSNPPTTSIGTTGATTRQISVGVVSGTIYYWKVISTDTEGNTSESSVFDFRVY